MSGAILLPVIIERLFSVDPPVVFVRPPKFVVIDMDRQSSNPTVVRCIVDSYPRARITWYHYGELLAEGSSFHLGNITKRDQQGIYSYRVETNGFETVTQDFIVFVKGKSRDQRMKMERRLECF